MSESDDLSLSDCDNFYAKRKLANITAPSNILNDVIDSDESEVNDISNCGNKDKTVAGNEDEYQSRWRKRKFTPVSEHKSYKERLHEHEEEMKKHEEERERKQEERDEKDERVRQEHKERNSWRERDRSRSRSSHRHHEHHHHHHD